MEIFATITAGVVIFVLGQIVQMFVLTAIQAFHKERGDTSYLLLRMQSAISNARLQDKLEWDDIKRMGPSLISAMNQIPFYDFLSGLGVFKLPPRKDVYAAAGEINLIANNLISHSAEMGENESALKKIRQLLRIETSFATS